MLLTLHLEKLWFHARHGLHPQEAVMGNEFEMDAQISFHHPDGVIEGIADTINYADVYQLIKDEMQQPRPLMETYLTELALILKEKYPQIKKIAITLYKLTAPIAAITGRVGVSIVKEY